MFCASVDGPRYTGLLRTVPSNAKVFLRGTYYSYAGKADLSKGYWNSKRKLGATKHFSEIIKIQFAIYCYVFLKHFSIVIA